MPTSRTPTQILAACVRAARKRDQLDPKLRAANDELRELWSEGRELGLDSKTLAAKSGVESVTVRYFWNPDKAGARAKARKGKPRKKAAAR